MTKILNVKKSPQTLEMQIFDLIDHYSLPEVLDRLTHVIYGQSGLPVNAGMERFWVDMEGYLEKAVETALTIQTIDPDCGHWGK